MALAFYEHPQNTSDSLAHAIRDASSPPLIHKQQFCAVLDGECDCLGLAFIQLHRECGYKGAITCRLYVDPLRGANCRGARRTWRCGDLSIDSLWYENLAIQHSQKFQLSYGSKRDQWRSIADNDQRRPKSDSVLRSSSKSGTS